MKTKHILTAMVLPAMLAACTADEIVENNNVNLDGVAKLNPITFTVGENADSRLLWDETGLGKWAWGAEDDSFSAFLVNAGTGNPVLDKLLTNYVYTSEDGYAYTTTSVMNEGTYWFYAPGNQDRGNDLISFKLPTAQGVDYYKSDEAQVFFTPLYQLAKDDAPENLGLELTSWYGRAVFPIKNQLSAGQSVNVKQIVLSLTGDDKWIVSGEISPVKLNENNLKYAFVDGEKTPILNTDNDATNNETLATLKSRLQKAYDVAVKTKTAKTLVLDLGSGIELANGQSYDFTMLVPATKAGVKCDVTIVTDKGIKTIASYNTSNYTQTGVQFKHNGLMPMFGLQNANTNQFKYYNLKGFDGGYSNVRFISTYEDMMNVINTVNGDIDVYNIGDWAIDAYMANAIENSDADITFVQPINVTDESTKVTLTKVQFTEGLTVTEGTKVKFGAYTTADKIVVEEGAEAELNNVYKEPEYDVNHDIVGYIGVDVENAGSLTINSTATVASVKSSGTLTLDNNNPSVEITAGTLNYNNSVANTTYKYDANNLTISRADDKNVDINIAAGVELKGNKAIQATSKKHTDGVTYYTTITNNGKINLGVAGGCDVTIDGKLVNNGTITGNLTALKINGSAENAGTIDGVTDINSGATLENTGILMSTTRVKNNGTITAKEGSTTKVSQGSGVIDNSEYALVQANENQTVKFVFEEDCDTEDLEALDAKKYAINKVVFEGKLSLNKNWENIAKVLVDVDVLEFTTGSSLYVNLPTTDALKVNVDKIIISDNVIFSGFEGYAKIEMQKAYTLHVCKNKTLTINNVVITGAAATYETDVLGEDDVQGAVIGGNVVALGATASQAAKH